MAIFVSQTFITLFVSCFRYFGVCFSKRLHIYCHNVLYRNYNHTFEKCDYDGSMMKTRQKQNAILNVLATFKLSTLGQTFFVSNMFFLFLRCNTIQQTILFTKRHKQQTPYDTNNIDISMSE